MQRAAIEEFTARQIDRGGKGITPGRPVRAWSRQ
jgi:hypothetical protein